MLLAGLVREGVVCTAEDSPLPQEFNMCTVDFVSSAIACIGMHFSSASSGATSAVVVQAAATSEAARRVEATMSPQAAPLVAHLCASRNISLSSLAAGARAAGHVLQEVDVLSFQRQLRGVTDSTHPLFVLKPQLGTADPTMSAGAGAASLGAGKRKNERQQWETRDANVPCSKEALRMLALSLTPTGGPDRDRRRGYPKFTLERIEAERHVTPAGLALALDFLAQDTVAAL
jgi:hypothetical protein